ncbi:MAG: response regulator [Acidobacteriota bacterium]
MTKSNIKEAAMQDTTVIPGVKNILAVDDEPDVCRSISKILKRRGYSVQEVASAQEALDAIRRGNRFDLVIADLMMPQAGGIELLKIVKDSFTGTNVLIVTGYASIASAVEAAKFGAAGYVAKPFTPEELEHAVEEALGGCRCFSEPDSLPPAGIIDVDMPFDAREVALATSPAYLEQLTRSDLAVARAPLKPIAPDYCLKGSRSCKRMRTKGVCEQEECPVVVAERKKQGMSHSLAAWIADPIDADMPFSYAEVAAATSESYARALGRSDMPVVGHWEEVVRAESAPRILVVDDEAVVVNSIRKSLTRKGYQIAESFGGVDALARIQAEEFSLVLLDMKLKDLNGLEMISTIRKLRPALPVVIVTGFASIDTAMEAIQRGAADYMPKPFTPDEIYGVTQRVLKQVAA